MKRKLKFYLIRIFIIFLVFEICYLVYTKNRNIQPISTPDEFEVLSGKKTVLNILINDLDSNNDSLFIDTYEGPYNGKIVNNGFNVEYISNKGFAGLDSFTYKVNDGKALSIATLVKLQVKKELDIIIEAEDFNRNVEYKPFYVLEDDSASGFKFVSTPENIEHSWDEVPNEGCLVYDFSIERDSEIRVWFRVKSERVGFWIAIDDQEPIDCYFYSTSSVWEWKNHGSIFNLKNGKHQIKIIRRRSGTRLDKIFITNIEKSAKEIEDFI